MNRLLSDECLSIINITQPNPSREFTVRGKVCSEVNERS